jgi:S1-C subfamily serine protease
MTLRHRVAFLLFSVGLGAVFTLILVQSRGRNRVPESATATTAAPSSPTTALNTPLPPLSPQARTEDERNTIAVFSRTAAGCVYVTQHQIVVDYWAGGEHDVPAGSGSGFVWDETGHIVTNFHVIAGAQHLTVTLHDQRTFPASVVGSESRKDIAVVKIDAPAGALTPILRHQERIELEVGQKVIAIGNPFGLDQSLTTGVISALGRQVDGIGGVKIREMVQTDAAINPGNSGGPLLDSTGRLIGMNTMIYSKSGSSAGIGFAVPATTIARVVPQLIKLGHVEQVGIGVDIDPERRLERRLGIRGLIVLAARPDSPAGAAGVQGLRRTVGGIELGDVIVGIDGKPINDYDDLYSMLDAKKAGEVIRVTVARNGRDHVDVSIKLVTLQ